MAVIDVWGIKKVKLKKICSALVKILLTITFISSVLEISISADTVVNAESKGLDSNSNKNNNKIFQKIIDDNRNDNLVINIPKGNYLFKSGAIRLHSNIIFNFEKGAIFSVENGNFLSFSYPSKFKGYNGGIKNVVWNNAVFKGEANGDKQSGIVQSMNHASNVTFNGCTFYNAEYPMGHYLDIDGSHGINVNNSNFFGFNSSKKYAYKEAIQIDYSNLVAMSYQLPGDKYDNLPSYDVKVQNCKFLPIIKKGKIKFYAPNPIGQHDTYDKGIAGVIHNVTFVNNTVIDPRPQNGTKEATLNFNGVSNLVIKSNYFINQLASGSTSYIRLNNPLDSYKMSQLNITNNYFENVDAKKQYILIGSNSSKKTVSSINISKNEVISGHFASKFIVSDFDLTDQNIFGDRYLDVVSH
ncbi:N-acetylmuramoyl-L-alanine amidase [Lactobacillus sp. CBA3605]|uniref:N-acetylmuramoyl-L-alanine amidase n=1 Tax=Lactobacillus sp. CBA3605 TaxID=2099788 RepID=UPI000CFB32B2|nr:N-acetylmuramoyl-L-alanine amidase [Lactobacillus sp. CBA3605]AVK62238.1 N-acetylmuramoyl-L-alanine amidase [Lactobacillus sp. CBA3605]